ncbi:hypothetical protein Tco_1029302 [Tanacetum coccineum]|uniref:Uncharacterized protein n=1 Tax=Tanacetum coccineum TaxID=301880 RepID=A0ABQ5G3D7_9ASTR
MLPHCNVQTDFIHVTSITGGLSYSICFPKVIGTVQIACANIVKKLVGIGPSPVVELKVHFLHAAYHKSCSSEIDDTLVTSNGLNFSFCGQNCRELYSRIQKLLWIKHDLGSGFSWSLIHRSDPLPDVSSVNYSRRVECNSKLAIALLVMDECFLPIVDTRIGITLFHNVVYNWYVVLEQVVKNNMPDLLSDVVNKKRRQTKLPKLKALADVTDKPVVGVVLEPAMSGGGTQNSLRKAISAIMDNNTVNLAKLLLASVNDVPVMAAAAGSADSNQESQVDHLSIRIARRHSYSR